MHNLLLENILFFGGGGVRGNFQVGDFHRDKVLRGGRFLGKLYREIFTREGGDFLT